jgi:phage terminase large subunit-like protein
MPRKPKHPARQYINDIQSRKVLSNRWVSLCVKRHLQDLEDGHERGIWFDETSAQHAIDFFQFLKHSKGEWSGENFTLEPWEQFILWNVFGWKREDGFRRFRTAYIEVARKNGKSTLLAGLGNYLLCADGEPGAEIYSAATKRDQAIITHSEAIRMVQKSQELRIGAGIRVFKNNLNIEGTASKFEPLGRDSDSMDGLNIHGAIVDELHAHKTREMWDVLDTGTGSRRQPLIFAITTAGFDRNTICWEQHEYTQKILEGSVNDDTYFGIIYCLDEEDDWQDEKLWIKANPNLGVSAKWDDLRRKAKRAKETPAALNAFLRKHMNLWTQAEIRWIDPEVWNQCAFFVDESSLSGKDCYGGLDLSSNIDITALALVFPPDKEDGLYQIIIRCWIPEENMQQRVHKDRVNYDMWVQEGYMTATPGNVIDYRWVLNELDQLAQKFDIVELAFDRWGATKVVQDLQEMGWDDEKNIHSPKHLIQFGQGYKSMSPPMKDLETLILSKKIAHGGHPVLSWAAGNVMASEDPAGNIKPNKEKSREKIDPIVALIMALDRARKKNITTSRYEEDGMTVI